MNRSTLLPIILAAIISLAVQLSPVRAGISYTGQLDPADPADWNDDTDCYIGISEDGTLTVNDGSEIFSEVGYIGYNSGINGTVNIDGSGSAWNLYSDFDYTTTSQSSIYVEVGSASVPSFIFDPRFPGPIIPGPIIPGPIIPAQSYTPLYVGYSGNGTLNITGGSVSNSSGYIGYNVGSTGIVAIDGADSTWTNNGNLFVGHSGNGTLNITGGSASNSCGYIGYNVGSTGIVTIDGADSIWTNSSSLYIGHSGTGTLNISGGAIVSVEDSTYVGYQAGSSGTINFGEGGGTLSTRSLYASATQLTGEGTINACGLVSDLDLVFDLTNGLTQTLTFNSLSGQNVTLNLDLSGTSSNVGDLGAGYYGTGSLSILEGVSVASGNGFIGFAAGSTGTAVVNASTWSISGKLYVGYCGNGSLSITNGATVSNSTGYIGYSTDTMNEVTLEGEGTSWTNSGDLYVGYSGNGTLGINNSSTAGQTSGGTLTVRNGSELNAHFGYIGYESGISGSVVVDGEGSTWSCVITGDEWNPYSYGSTTSSLYVGYSGTGSLEIINGGTVENSIGIIGYNSGSSGVVTVSGEDSIWLNQIYVTYTSPYTPPITIEFPHYASGSSLSATATSTAISYYDSPIYVGHSGSGELNIFDGGEVVNATAYIGFNVGSNGVANIDGSNTTWNNSESLYIGHSGAGTINISGGATVSVEESTYVGYQTGSSGQINFGEGNGTLNTRSLFASPSQLAGEGTINTRGLVSDLDLVFDSSNGPVRTLTFNGLSGQNVTLNLDMSGTSGDVGDLGAGYRGTGSLSILEGVSVSSDNGYIGFAAGSTGTGVVNASTWSMSGDLTVGYCGNGSLSISNSATVSNHTGYIGHEADSVGEVNVSGAGTTWNNGGSYVGYFGHGTLNISGGATLNSSCIIGYGEGAVGIVSVDGGDTRLVNTSSLYIGKCGNGVLNISGGAIVTIEKDACLAVEEGASGAINFGPGGGTLSSQSLMASSTQLTGEGVINTRGLVSDVAIVFDSENGLTQSLLLDDVAGQNISINLDMSGATGDVGDLGVGYLGNGTLNISGGIVAQSRYGYLGYHAGSTGTCTVSGIGATWDIDSNIVAGRYGNGYLFVTNGGRVVSHLAYIGLYADSSGAVTVDGSGSTWTGDSAIYIGMSGHGTLSIINGAATSNNSGYIGFHDDSTGGVSVSGTGSTWTVDNKLYIGYSGDGRLDINNGAVVANGSHAYITYSSGSTGSVNVDGVGSEWNIADNLYVGNWGGDGVLNITGGGYLSVSSVSINNQSLMAIDIGNGSLLDIKSGSGSIDNDGTVCILAGAEVGTDGTPYSPISAATWTGSGVYQAVGGTWNETTHEFTVSDVVQGNSGAQLSIDSADDQRVLIVGGSSVWELGMSFLHKTGEVTELLLTATAINTLDDLQSLLGDNDSVLGAWNIELAGDGYTDGDPVYLSFDVGAGYKRGDLTVWHFDEGVWSEFDAMDLTVNDGWASFTATEFSGYAVTGVPVPEPGTLVLLLAAALGLAVFARRKRL